MKEYTSPSGLVLKKGMVVWYLRAPFEIGKIYRDKLGVVKVDLATVRNIKRYDDGKILSYESSNIFDVVANANDIKLSYKNKYDKRKEV